ncbi:hypothetical protein SY88_06965 [Clostridiales bacterium PH28_bin88]|nr:hypothetical protein SY88_06965 [Clostridiales bacterium PH28_bin88]
MSRRAAREKAFQILFQIDVGRARPSEAIQATLEEAGLDQKGKEYIERVVHGTIRHLNELDGYIRRFAVDWEVGRLANVDRSLLRLALFEMLHMDDIPHTVSINEAVELCKIFNSEESSRFINGLLDRMKQQLESGQDGQS